MIGLPGNVGIETLENLAGDIEPGASGTWLTVRAYALDGRRRPDPRTAPSKSEAAGLYMICTLSKHAAEKAGCNDALMLDWRGQIAEATGANIFLVIDGAIHTPTPDCFLDGITRRTVIGLAKERGHEIIERAISECQQGIVKREFVTWTTTGFYNHCTLSDISAMIPVDGGYSIR